mmetsp:Transcript_411/g.477  ORF Transcript_411/g.477 Transcript_411/m.477 type:complete len:421 (+) Transcript_411:32-1294(+)
MEAVTEEQPVQQTPVTQENETADNDTKVQVFTDEVSKVTIAVEGCCHGELDAIYNTVKEIEEKHDKNIDLVLLCGDVQAARNQADMASMAMPPTYRTLGDFHQYYNGEKKAPYLTIIIGGNHEAALYFWEMPFGGWIAPNIYYLGFAGVVNYGGLRIMGLSGIFKHYNYFKGHWEAPPFTDNHLVKKKSYYHIKEYQIWRMSLLTGNFDVALSHDWPTGVYNHGDKQTLLRMKPYFRQEVYSNRLGNPHGKYLLDKLQPKYWFSAHLHVKFAAVCPHTHNNKETKFLALDKCLPGKHFLQVVDVDCSSEGEKKLTYDPEWLAITKMTWRFWPSNHWQLTDEMKAILTVDDETLSWVKKEFNGNYEIPLNFEKTASLDSEEVKLTPITDFTQNPQTMALMKRLGIFPTPIEPEANPEEIEL